MKQTAINILALIGAGAIIYAGYTKFFGVNKSSTTITSSTTPPIEGTVQTK